MHPFLVNILMNSDKLGKEMATHSSIFAWRIPWTEEPGWLQSSVSDAIQPSQSSVVPFSSCLQSFPAPGSFPTSELFTSDGQSIGVSASSSVLPMNIQGWFRLGLTGLISLVSKGLSRVFSSTTIQKHQFFKDQPSSWSNSHIHTGLLGKPSLCLDRSLSAN